MLQQNKNAGCTDLKENSFARILVDETKATSGVGRQGPNFISVSDNI